MTDVRRKGVSKVNVILIFSLIFILLSPPNESSAQRQERGHRIETRAHGHGIMIKGLPRDHQRLLVSGREYFYSGGVFYRIAPGGYTAVPGPFGAHIRVLPLGYQTVRIRGTSLFFYYDTYYRWDRVAKDYIVVAPPPTAPFPQQNNDKIELTDGQTINGWYVGGTADTVSVEVNGIVQDIPVEKILLIQFAPPQQQ
jgi:hypothetical protein